MRFKVLLIVLSLVLGFGLLTHSVNAENGSGSEAGNQGEHGTSTSTPTSKLREFLFGHGKPKPSDAPKDASGEGLQTNFLFGKLKGKPQLSPEPNPSKHLDSSNSGELKGLGKLEGGKLVSCEARQDAVNKRISSLSDLVINMVAKFDAIALRVENYYTNTLVPSGKTVPNYDALVTDIATKKEAVQTALTSAQDTTTTTFDCKSDDPKGFLSEFRVNMQGVKKALEEYRKSIRNLIVAVRGTLREHESPVPSASSSASASPVVSPSPSLEPSPVVSATP